MKKSLDIYNLSDKTSYKISLATLYRYYPKHVKLQGKIPLHQDCWEKCLNLKNVAKIIAQYLDGTHKDIYSGVIPHCADILVSLISTKIGGSGTCL